MTVPIQVALLILIVQSKEMVGLNSTLPVQGQKQKAKRDDLPLTSPQMLFVSPYYIPPNLR